MPHAPSTPDDDDFEPDLPPMDDDDGEGTSDHGDEGAEGDDIDEVDEEDRSLDDTESGDLSVGEDIDDVVEEGAGADDDAEGLDVGALDDEVDEVAERADPDDPAGEIGDEDDDEDLDEPRDEDDGGAEGTTDSAEDSVDESALAPLGDDENDEDDEEGVTEAEEDSLLESGGDPPLPGWAAKPWEVREQAGATIACRSVAAHAGRVLATGETTLLVDEGSLGARVIEGVEDGLAVTLGGEGLGLIITRSGQLFGVEAEGSLDLLTTWRGTHEEATIASAVGRTWVLWGGVLCAAGASPREAPSPRDRGVLAIAASRQVLTILRRESEQLVIEHLRGDDEGWRAAPLRGPLRSVAAGPEPILMTAMGGALIAIGEPSRGALLSRDAGATFQAIDVLGTVAMAFAGDEPTAPLLILAATGSTGHLIELDAHGGATRIAAVRLDQADDELASASMAWDAARELVWIASGAGLIALGRTNTH